MLAELPTLTEPLLTVEEVARRLNATPHTINRLIRDGLLDGIKVGREWRIDPAEFKDFLQRNKRSQKEED